MNKYICVVFTVLLSINFACSSAGENANRATVNTGANVATANTVADEPLPDIDVTKPFAPSDDPKMDLISSTKRLQEHDSWSATLTNNLFPEMPTELEYVKPDRYHIKNPANEIIVIGRDGYAKGAKGWEKLDEDFGAQVEQMKRSFNSAGMKNIGEVTKAGSEKVDGKDALIYSYSINTGPNGVKNSTKVWIANDSGLPLRIVVETQSTDAMQIITTNYDYSKQVKIEAPKVSAGTGNSQK